MNRLHFELQRLYLIAPTGGQQAPDEATDAPSPAPGEASIDAGGQVRALVLGLARPADWSLLAAVWQGVQADLELPAPAIAVDGREGYQLWFSLARPVPATQGRAWLEALRRRYLAEVQPRRIELLPAPGGEPPPPAATAEVPPWRHARLVPALQPGGLWSAFVAPDLAPMFADEPGLDLPPNVDGQARLLAGLASIQPDQLERAAVLLGLPGDTPTGAQPSADRAWASPDVTASPEPAAAQALPAGAPTPPTPLAPRRFLLEVMNDAAVPLALRIEAAKALLAADTAAGRG